MILYALKFIQFVVWETSIFGKLTGGVLEGCEIPSAAKTVLAQCAPAHLTKMADWRQDDSFASSLDQDWPFSAEV